VYRPTSSIVVNEINRTNRTAEKGERSVVVYNLSSPCVVVFLVLLSWQSLLSWLLHIHPEFQLLKHTMLLLESADNLQCCMYCVDLILSHKKDVSHFINLLSQVTLLIIKLQFNSKRDKLTRFGNSKVNFSKLSREQSLQFAVDNLYLG